ncbi:hypothetical protein LR48_Vigan04g189500 [Vigna angularis]|uniref:Methyltransferase type 11 domain-containing protein n=1 Tax=Phaseolus angularis TaxID=3914 RepID=A0A0L9UGK8_PHAAN|nr:hypothetical protein LR48_Vigan04g189500 [Vigna angularis]
MAIGGAVAIMYTRSPPLSSFTPTRLFSRSHFAAKLRFPPSIRLRASSTAVIDTETNPTESVVVEKEVRNSSNPLACPVCYDSLTWNGGPGFSVDTISGSNFQCGTCQKTYIGNQTHIDLTATGGAKSYGDTMPFSTELFRHSSSLVPLISFLYERGWRQTFSVWGGFPGPEKEFELMKGFLKPVLGGNIVDASCASGLFSRLFAKSQLFSFVVALDYSENMLQQCYEFIQQEENFPKENLILVRADISRLPFVSNSIDAVHAGAALHCWPSPLAAVAEISRVLRPGGVFVATTYILDGPFSIIPFRSILRQTLRQASGNYSFLSERELEDLCRACGLVGFKCIRNGPFVMISARKPS